MSIEQQIVDLATATTNLLGAVNVRKSALDAAAESASASATAAQSAAQAAEGFVAAAQAAAQAAESFADALVASPTVERIEVVTAAQYAALTPVASTLYVIEN
jgi:hypothetical protein